MAHGVCDLGNLPLSLGWNLLPKNRSIGLVNLSGIATLMNQTRNLGMRIEASGKRRPKGPGDGELCVVMMLLFAVDS